MIRRLKWAMTALLLATAVATISEGQRVFEAITRSNAEFLYNFHASASAPARRQEFERNASDSSVSGTQPPAEEVPLQVLDDQAGPPRHEAFLRSAPDGRWSQIWFRDTSPDGTVVETPGPIMDEFTIPPNPTPSDFFESSTDVLALRAPDPLEWASVMGNPTPFELNQGVSYQPPPDALANSETNVSDLLGENGIFTREYWNPDENGFYDLHNQRVPETFVGGGLASLQPREESLNQGLNYRPPSAPANVPQKFDTDMNQGADYLDCDAVIQRQTSSLAEGIFSK